MKKSLKMKLTSILLVLLMALPNNLIFAAEEETSLASESTEASSVEVQPAQGGEIVTKVVEQDETSTQASEVDIKATETTKTTEEEAQETSSSSFEDKGKLKENELRPAKKKVKKENILHETTFPLAALANTFSNYKDAEKRQDSPVIGEDHPTVPGEVMLFKEVKPVEGKVNTAEVTLRLEGKNKPTTNDIVLVIDTSGSMNDNNRMRAAKNAANTFIDKLLPSETTRIGIVSFASYGYVKNTLTNDIVSLKPSVNGLRANGGTFTQGGMHLAKQMLEDSPADHKDIILLSDGEPTYSYLLSNPEDYAEPFGLYNYETSANIPETAFNYRYRVGAGNDINSYIKRMGYGSLYYNHGNSAIAESSFIKDKGINLSTVAIELEESHIGRQVLVDMASPGKFYDASTPDNLTEILDDIAGEIGSAIRNADISDPMGNGFEIPAERIKDIKKSQGELSFNKETKTIHWDLGAFNKPIATGSDINYAELTYIVEINDDILDASASEGKRYATNGNAKINYTNVDGERVEKSFPVPKFKPVFYEINKELLDKDGRVINKDIDFKLSITGPLETREIIVNPSKNDGVRQLTDLRNPGVYTFKEIDEGTDYNLEDYDVTYFINGQEVTEPSFTIDEDNLEDISLKIVNQEKSGSLKISKILEQSSRRFGLEALNAKNEGISFNFKVTGPDNYSARFSLPENGSWTKELNNLSLGTYTISEEISDEYSTYISVDNGESALRNEIEVDILNGQHEREVKVRNVLNNEWTLSAEKQWVGGPKAKPEVYFQLIRVNKDGTETKIAEPRQVIATKVTWKQSDLDVNANEFVRYDQDGQEYSYKVQEVDVNGNDYVPTNYSKSEEALSVTNTYTKKLDIPVQKDWDDNNDQDGKRPEVVEVSLYKDGKQTAEKLYLNASNQWSGKFTALEEYADGEKIEYSVKETPVGAGYTSNITGTAETGFTITNTREVEKTTVSGSKIWQDHDNQDGKRPKSITIRVLKDGQEIASQEVTAADNWQWEFTDLDKYEDGELIKYTLAEDSVPEYSAQVLGHDVINTHTPGKSSVQVTKKWDDSNNQDGKRPETVSVNLLADNVDTGKTLVLSAANNWTANFTNLDEFKDGVAIDYTVRELDVTNGYTASITGSAETGYLITNSREVEKVDVAGSKTWADRGNQDGKRPPSITIRLLKNGEEIDSKTVSASDDWAWEFTDLDKYEAGQKIDYRITEDVIPGYETVITDYDVKNTHKPGKVSVPVRKVWLDANDQDGLRPESVKIKLIANGEVTDESLILTENSGWSARFTDLDEFKDGEKIEYTVLEEAVKGYKSNIEATEHNGFKITNSRNPETINIEGSKTWDDNDNQDGKRPESITIRLLKNGEEVDKRIVSAQEAWQWSFEDLPKNEQGEEIDYTITEDIVSEYTTKVQGYNVTNTHAPGKTEVKVIKSWADANDQDGKRPESVSVSLFANGEDTGQKLILTATNNWAGRFHNLDKYKDGKEIDYTVVEEAIGNGYTSSISGNQNTAYTITNSRKVEKVDVKGRKTWADKNDQDGKRPESLTVYLLRNGEKVDSQVVSASDNWAWEFTDLDKYEAGELIKYTLT